jgi:predicted nucleic acid-binding protein
MEWKYSKKSVTMRGRFILDTNAAIDLLNGKPISPDLDAQLFRGRRYASVMTEIELYAFPRINPEEADKIRRFLSKLTTVPLKKNIKQLTIAIRRQNTKLKIPDAAIAATAVLFNATLLTSDPHLLKLQWPGLTVLDYRQDRP